MEDDVLLRGPRCPRSEVEVLNLWPRRSCTEADAQETVSSARSNFPIIHLKRMRRRYRYKKVYILINLYNIMNNRKKVINEGNK